MTLGINKQLCQEVALRTSGLLSSGIHLEDMEDNGKRGARDAENV
jgi:hypothetical protein